MLQISYTQQCHVAIHNFYLRTTLHCRGLCVSMSILISKLPLPCSLGLQSSYFLKLRHYEKPQNLKKCPTCFDKTAVFTQQRQNKWEIISNFCGVFRKAGLVINPRWPWILKSVHFKSTVARSSVLLKL